MVAFIAGLLHDIGKLILGANAEREYRVACDLSAKTGLPLEHAERGMFGCSHADVGAYLLVLWSFPDCVVEAVENHHKLSAINGFTPSLAVHLAQCLDPSEQRTRQLSTTVLRKLGFESRLQKWKEVLGEA